MPLSSHESILKFAIVPFWNENYCYHAVLLKLETLRITARRTLFQSCLVAANFTRLALRTIYGISDMVAFAIGFVCNAAIGVYAQPRLGVPLIGFAGHVRIIGGY